MDLLKSGLRARWLFLVAIWVLAAPSVLSAEEYKSFSSEEYGFTMKYPAAWVKIDKPKGNYYVVFQSPDLTDNFRNRIHVAAHEPVKDPLKVFLQELRNGIKDLQTRAASGGPDAQQVKILDEGEFKCEVPGAHYFFIQAFENKLNIWMDIVIVFFKHEQTLLRISCLAPSTTMEKMQPLFNEVLVSVSFASQQKAAAKPAPKPAQPAYQTEEAPQYEQPPAPPPQTRPAPPSRPNTGPAYRTPAQPPAQPPAYSQPEEQEEEAAPPPPQPAPRPAPRGPGRAPTGIVQ